MSQYSNKFTRCAFSFSRPAAGKGSLHMAKLSLAKCLSSMNTPASLTHQPHKNRQPQPDQEQPQPNQTAQQQQKQPKQQRRRRQPGEKLVEFSAQLYKSAYVTAS